mmetsp:Transcript_32324/g.23871  ORF Transcript_32324/g.23871 Transcript_32324/m.23871 type:complete len:88 (+) Transcript_32324:328-591(+)
MDTRTLLNELMSLEKSLKEFNLLIRSYNEEAKREEAEKEHLEAFEFLEKAQELEVEAEGMRQRRKVMVKILEERRREKGVDRVKRKL